ncbi:MAG: hypothetical protein KY476_16770 [Planctomycetes bacterium]|nr:hypothetical protein [Planctomycetota bacterium]
MNVYPQDIEDCVSQIDSIQPGRVVAFSTFDSQAQSERVTILAESALRDTAKASAIIEIRQRLLAAFQIANFDVELLAPGWLLKSSSGKIARNANREKWAQRSE